ncbi:preprotein translocase subunit SecG [bacterium]|nr:preprotein translocase subunit SecG [bacterium]
MIIIISFFLILFVVVSVLLTIIILVQDTKGEGMSGIFGGMGAETLLGGRGVATFLSKLTTYLAIGYIILALILAKFYGTTSTQIPQPEPKQESIQTDTEGESAEGTISMPSEDAEEATETETTNEEK